MKAILLAAGVGSRLRPLTDHTPKCLVDIHGTPLLGIWFQMLAASGVSEVLVNTHHLAEKVEQYVANHRVPGLRVNLSHEVVLRGSAGTISDNRDFVAGEDTFWVIYADNLTNMSLSAMLAFHRSRKSEFTMGLFRTPQPTECGIATLDSTGRVTAFVEKPAKPDSDLANAGLYLAGPRIFQRIPQKPLADFGFDVLPQLVGTMYGYPIPGFYCDLGTPERLEKALREWTPPPVK